MVRPLINFWRRPWSDKWLFIQVYFLLGVSRLAILTLRFKRLAARLGQHMEESSDELTDDEIEVSRRISWAVRRASALTPWKSNCFPQAITAQYLLRRNKIVSTLYLGAMLDDDEGMKAHAWLRCGPRIVTGREAHRQFGVVATFSATMKSKERVDERHCSG